ncbi:hypothetical protein [Deinococcus sp.]|uniref:hypothetical protein n=1 Tax=Deinococcus sp. TaxID=47478 RepID=UPI003B59C504
MVRLLLAGIGLILVALLSLAALWLLGELFAGVGQTLVGFSALLARLLRFVVVAGGLGGAVYILTSAWSRPGRQAAPSKSSEHGV